MSAKMRKSITYGNMRTPLEKEIDARIVQNVERGLARLRDEFGDGWVERIDPARLDLSDGSRCVLGQVYGGYMSGLYELNLGDAEAREFGFQADSRQAYKDLDSIWKPVISRIKAMREKS